MSNKQIKETNEASEELRDRPGVTNRDVRDLYKNFDPTEELKQGAIEVKNPHPDLFYKLVTMDPRSIARAENEGYRTLDEIDSHLDTDHNGENVGSYGTRVKWMACLKEHRDIRHSRDMKRLERENKIVYGEDIHAGEELPISGQRANPPPGYTPDL